MAKKRHQPPVYVVIPSIPGLFLLFDLRSHTICGTAYTTRDEACAAARRLSDPHVIVTETWKE
jgi:hypothetical protein